MVPPSMYPAPNVLPAPLCQSLPLVGVHGGLDSTIGGTNSAGFSLARQDLTAQLSTPGALALRKVTTLLQGPRRADPPGEHQQAQELYSEVQS